MFSQFAGFNLRIGRKLDLVVKDYARQHESLVVVAGPILENGSALNSANNVLVPSAYFKVVLDISEPTFEGLAFVVPSAESNERVHETGVVEIEKYVVPIAKVEQLTGLDLFANLENDLETQIERRINYSHWNIENTPSPVNPKSWGEIKNR
jgi:endonuclease G